MKKRIFNNRFTIFGLILLILILSGVFAYFSLARRDLALYRLVRGLAGRKGFVNPSGKFADLIKENNPTPVMTNTPTPTPTLTPLQIEEIERKKFADLNQKYGPCKRVPILMYHHIMDSATAKKIGATNLNVPPEIFRQQMDYLIGKGYSIVGLNQLPSMIAGNALQSKPVVLTFDDGYRDFFDSAYGILREKNLKATVFVISQFIGGARYLEWWQIKEMVDSGLILIGDHTLNHPSLPKLTKEEEFNQIVSAKNVIEQNTGVRVNLFAYPYGGVNQNSRDILKENGFIGAVTTMIGNTQCVGLPYDLQRIRIGGGSLSRYGL